MFYILVKWCELSPDLILEVTDYIKELCSHTGQVPTKTVIKTRFKRFYRSQRNRLTTADDQDKRRRRRFQNRRNRLTMVGL